VLAIGVLGVLLIAGEYSTGMIRATMTAVPKRLPVLWGKYGAVALVLSAILRNTAAGIASFAGIMFVIPPFVSILPSSLADSIDPYLPSNAGEAMMRIGNHAHTLSPGAGLAVFAGYVAVTIAAAAAAVLLVRRDV
jgi:ABC-2 type transport system permease protein